MKKTSHQPQKADMNPSLRLDHIGIVVRDLKATAKALEKTLDWKLERIENYRQSLAIGFFSFGDVKVELIQPLTDEGMNVDFLRHRGEGVQHLAFRVPNLKEAVKQAGLQGIQLLLEPTLGVEGKPIAFLKGEGLGGTALELIEYSEEDPVT